VSDVGPPGLHEQPHQLRTVNHFTEPLVEARGLGNTSRRSGAGGVVTVQFNVLWQLPQSRVVITCVTGLLAARTPLWQLRQVALTPTWLKVATVHEIVPWQAAQSCVVCTCCLGLPDASTPLWQVEHIAVTPW